MSKRRRRKIVFWLAACAGAALLSQTVWAHRTPPFTPDEPPLALEPLLAEGDLEALSLQTGLSPAALKALLAQDGGTARIAACQAALFAQRPVECRGFIGGLLSREDCLAEESLLPPLAPLEQGDLLVTFSTHTLGWRHGHAGLALDGRTVLEAVQPFQDSAAFPAEHWQTYAHFLILRVRDASPEERAAAAELAGTQLLGVPYSFLCGFRDSGGCHCAYLPWYAWSSLGYDLDSDGGRLVTVADLAASPYLEVVQAAGLDPRLFAGRWAQ